MIFLGENEMSCHAKSIGFPSIDNCRAIVMVTGGGLIGCHLFGTLEKKKPALFSYFDSQPYSADKRTLYIVSKMATHTAQGFAEEVRSIAAGMNFTGPVYTADVTSFGPSGILVVFDNVTNHTCIVTARAWNRDVDGADTNKEPYAPLGRAMAIGRAPGLMLKSTK